MKNFIIVGTQRTGSSAIAESLGLHPTVTCGWEWTHRIPPWKKLKTAELALKGDFSMLRQSHRSNMDENFNLNCSWLGFRWLFSASGKWLIRPSFSPALWFDRLEGFIGWISHHPEIHVIHIVRKDSLDWLKSVYLAKKFKVYSKIKYPNGIKIKIPKLEAIRRLQSKNWVDLRLSNIKRHNPFIQIYYEEFLEDPKKITTFGLNFLEFDSEISNLGERKLHKQSKGKPSDYIINYNSLIEILTKNRLL